MNTMKLMEICEAIKNLMNTTGCNLIVGSDINNNFYCKLEDCYIAENSVLNGDCGRGKTIEDAMEEYLALIRGRKLVIHPSGKNRKEMFVIGW